MARSMLSLGIEASLAFSTAVASAGLKLGSPPPSRAATSILFASLAKSLPRAASWRPLRCLMFAHLECPAMGLLLRVAVNEIEEHPMDAIVVGEFRVERRSVYPSLAHHHRMIVDGGQHLDRGPVLLYPRGTDEDGMERLIETPDVEVGFERVVLATEGVAADDDVEAPELWLGSLGHAGGEKDHPRANAEHGHSGFDAVAQGLQQIEALGETADRGRLAAGDDERVDGFEVVGALDQPGLDTERAQRPDVLTDIALQGEDAHPGHGSPASRRQPLGLAQLFQLDAGHGLAEAGGDLGDLGGILPVGGGFDDRPGIRLGIRALEDAGPDEDPIATEGHHQRGVGGGRDAPGGEVDDRQPT